MWTKMMLECRESHKMFRTAKHFYNLHDLLVSSYGLESSLHMNSIESLAMFLVVCGHGTSYGLHGISKHSSETISRKFEEVLNELYGGYGCNLHKAH
jgi:hypothetical protein